MEDKLRQLWHYMRFFEGVMSEQMASFHMAIISIMEIATLGFKLGVATWIMTHMVYYGCWDEGEGMMSSVQVFSH